MNEGSWANNFRRNRLRNNKLVSVTGKDNRKVSSKKRELLTELAPVP